MSNVYEIVTDRILDCLSNGVVPWRKPWHTETPKNLISGKPYRGVNVLLLEAAHYECRHWLTFNQAKSLGGSVKKGERGTPVIFWKVTDKKDDKGETEKSFLLRYYTVFNVNQCEGIEAPAPAPRQAFNPIEACERIVSSYEGKPRIDQGGSHAFYSPVEDRIQIPAREAFTSAPEFYSTLFHELVHSTGSHDRLARKGVTDPISFASHNYSFEELVAECGSAFLCSEGGIAANTIENSAAYIASWSKKLRSEPRWIVQASAQAAKAADLVLGRTAASKSNEEPSAEAA
jgi:antirestriction protein ArdC